MAPTEILSIPFPKALQLCHALDDTTEATDAINATDGSISQKIATLPGHPNILLSDAPSLTQFLESEFCSQDLETFAPHLWVMSTFSSANINALHRQRVKGRDIVITEEPRLHLVWIQDRIFIKPLPAYLLSYTFWLQFLDKTSTQPDPVRKRVRMAALGFLRTYFFLIRHESDFMIAKHNDLRLVPSDVDWTAFCRFISVVGQISDHEVSGRYHYGELRLSRLNLYAPLFLRKYFFEQVHGQYAERFARLYAPILFLFAVVTTLLNAMQVGMAVEQVSSRHWIAFWSVSRWFSVVSLVATALIAVCFVMLWIWFVTDEWIFALRMKWRKGSKSPYPIFEEC